MKVDDSLLSAMARVYAQCEGTPAECMGAAVSLIPDPGPPQVFECEAAMRMADQVAMTVVGELEQRQALTEEDMRLIRDHVRPKDSGDAVEAAVLKERIRCARIAVYYGAAESSGLVVGVLSGEGAK